MVQQEADKTKKLLRDVLTAQAVDISRRVVAYATNVNNRTLLSLVNYSESDLKKSSDQKLVSSCQVVHDNAIANVAALPAYGVTEATLTTLQTAINSFNESIPLVRVDTTDSSKVTKQLTDLFKTLSANWDKLDTLVEMVRTSEPSFYSNYQNARRIVETGTSSLLLKIKVINAQTGAPEANVTLTLIPTNGLLKAAGANGKSSIVKKTAAGGSSNYKSLADGTYTLEAVKPGFKTITETVSVVNGEMTLLEISMEKA
jgi:hypothetical protein